MLRRGPPHRCRRRPPAARRHGRVEPLVLAQAGRQVLDARAPRALVAAEREHELLALGEEGVVDPVFRVRLAVKGGALDVDGLVRRVEVDVADGGGVVGEGVRDVDRLEVGRDDEVDVLARVGEEAHHGEGDEGAHGAAVVVAGQAVVGRAEEARDVVVAAARRQRRAPRVVVLEDGEEGRLVADVGDVGVVQVLEAAHELGGPAEGRDEGCLVVRDVERVLPDGRLEGLARRVLQAAHAVGERVDVAAAQRVLEAPGAVEVARLEEADEARVGAVQKGRLVDLEEILPVAAALLVFRDVGIEVADSTGELRDGEVVVRVFERTRDTPGHGAESLVVEVLNGNVSQ